MQSSKAIRVSILFFYIKWILNWLNPIRVSLPGSTKMSTSLFMNYLAHFFASSGKVAENIMTCLECVIFINIFCSMFLMLSLASTLSHSSTIKYSVCIDQDLPCLRAACLPSRKFVIVPEYLSQCEASIICCTTVIFVFQQAILQKSRQFSNQDF